MISTSSRVLCLLVAVSSLRLFAAPAIELQESAECRSPSALEPAGNYIVPGTRGKIVYREIDGSELAMDAFYDPAEPSRPLVILIHGGAWTGGSRVTFISQWLEWLTRIGVNWASVDYRVGPGVTLDQQLDDLDAAADMIRCNARRFQADPGRLVLWGEHAGAYLAALAAARSPERYRGVVLMGGIYDPTDLPAWKTDGHWRRSLTGESRAAAELALARAAVRHMPPILAVHGGADTEVPFAAVRSYCAEVRENRGSCSEIEVAGGTHRAENWLPSQQSYRSAVEEWLVTQVGPLSGRTGFPEHPNLRKDLRFSRLPGNGSSTGLRLDAWIPTGEGPFPAAILVHGGGWEAGSKVTYLAPLLGLLARAGFAWFSIDYRLTPDVLHPEQVADVQRAIRFIRHHAREFNVDPERMALIGESAGGQLVMQVAASPGSGDPAASDPVDRVSCQVAGVVSFYGVYDFLPLVADAGPRSFLFRLFGHSRLDDDGRELLRQYSPYFHVHPGMPPVLLIHGTAERLWEQGLAMQQRLREVGVPVEMVALPGAPHGMEHWEGRPEWAYGDALVRWLRETLSPPSAR